MNYMSEKEIRTKNIKLLKQLNVILFNILL